MNENINPQEAEEILSLFMNAQLAFDHGDDVNHMLSFAKATERMMNYFHEKANGKPPSAKASGVAS